MLRGTVAIVGRPNVGKSTIFNRLIGQRKSIVDDTPGVTRDRIYGDIAIEEADVILFVTSAIEGVTSDDVAIARKLQKSKKPIVLAVNKTDNEALQMMQYDFYQLALGDPMVVSGAHGIGFGDVLDKIMDLLPEKAIEPYEGITSFCCIGRPNVGKSSLVNAILKEDRVIVSDVEGTTRDAIDT